MTHAKSFREFSHPETFPFNAMFQVGKKTVQDMGTVEEYEYRGKISAEVRFNANMPFFPCSGRSGKNHKKNKPIFTINDQSSTDTRSLGYIPYLRQTSYIRFPTLF
jgi:hypothetical protein